jgi:glycosyltransferase involved in cell wall biosynthesis
MKRFTIIIPFHTPYRWHTDYPNQTATLLSRRHHVVVFCWGDAVAFRDAVRHPLSFRMITNLSPRLTLIKPVHFLPLQRLAGIKRINFIINVIILNVVAGQIAARTNTPRLLWMFGFFEPLFPLLPHWVRYRKLFYDCLDIAWHPDPEIRTQFIRSERHLISRATWMSVNSETLYRRWRAIRPDLIRSVAGARAIDGNVPRPMPLPFPQNAPIIGYIGALDYRIDWRLLSAVIRRNPQWNYLLLGPVFTDDKTTNRAINTLRMLPNVLIAKTDSYATVRRYLAATDVGIIPYDTRLPFNRYCNPLKLMEYFAAGLPVIATDIEELRHYPTFVTTGTTISSWQRAIRTALSSPPNERDKRAMRRIAADNAWSRKVGRLCRVIEA